MALNRTSPKTRRTAANIDQQLLTWWKLQGLTAEQVAERAGLSRATLGKIEIGELGVGFEAFLDIARVLGLSPQLNTAFDPYETDMGVCAGRRAVAAAGAPMSEVIHVDVYLPGGVQNVGTAYISVRRRMASTTFTYSSDYLSSPGAYAIDPGLPLASGAHHVQGLPGAFADSAPDRWGRCMNAKRFRQLAREAERTVSEPTERDFLLEVADLTRQGALRFRLGEGPYLHPDTQIPKLIALPALLNAANTIESDGDPTAALKILLDNVGYRQSWWCVAQGLRHGWGTSLPLQSSLASRTSGASLRGRPRPCNWVRRRKYTYRRHGLNMWARSRSFCSMDSTVRAALVLATFPA